MKKEQFDQVFDRAFESAIHQSFQAIQPPSAAQLRSSWQHLHRKHVKAIATKVLLPASGSEQRTEDRL